MAWASRKSLARTALIASAVLALAGCETTGFSPPRAKIAELCGSGSYRSPIVTQVEPATTFWKAEEYHQRYLEKRGMVSCHI